MKSLLASLCLCLIVPSARAGEGVAVSGGRTASVPLIAPNFFQTLQLRKGVGAAADLRLPGIQQLRAPDLTKPALNDSRAEIPALPPSLVPQGASLENSVQTDASRLVPPGDETASPAIKRLRRQLAEKTQRLQSPIDAVARGGENAASPDELSRLGAVIFDVMAAHAASESAARTNGIGAILPGSAAAASQRMVGGTLLALADSRGAKPSDAGASATGGASEDGILSNERGISAEASKNSETSGGSGEDALSRRESLSSDVPLIAMDVAGQVLTFSRIGGAGLEARDAAAAVAGSLRGSEQSGETSHSAAARMNYHRAASPRFSWSGWEYEDAADFAASAAGIGEDPSPSESAPAAAPARNPFKRNTPASRPPFVPNAAPWATMLSVVLLALTAIPERRA